MTYLPMNSLRKNNMLFARSFIILLLTCTTVRIKLCFSSTAIPSSLRLLSLDGHFNFDDVDHAATDFGNRFQFRPSAVLHPKSVFDIANTLKHIWQMGPHSEIKVAARGHGHSLQGQSQVHRGIVIHMESLQGPKMQVHAGNLPYVDVSGGELWINILHESLKYGLAPKSWTDYLHLTVGGTLSNAGVSGQAFRHGPQISNVHQLEVITVFLEDLVSLASLHGQEYHLNQHFGPQWQAFVQRKYAYDPLAILAPGQRIFHKALPFP